MEFSANIRFQTALKRLENGISRKTPVTLKVTGVYENDTEKPKEEALLLK